MSAFIERIKRLHEERARTFEALKAVVDGAEAEKRSLTAEEQGKFETISNDLDSLDEGIRSLESAATAADQAAEARARLGLGDGPEVRSDDLSARFRKVGTGELRHFDVDLPMTINEARALLTTVPASAGNLTQKQFVAQFLSTIADRSSILQLGPRIITTTDGNLLEFPRRLTRMATAARVDENATIPKLADPTFDRVQLSVRKYAGIAQLSHEMADDSIIDLSSLLVDELGEAVAEAFNADLYTGDGVNKPKGLLTYAAAAGQVGVTGGAAAAPTFDNLIDLEYSMAPQFRPRAKWLMNDQTVRTLRKVKDNDGQYIWQPAVTAGVPSLILGRPYVTDEHIPVVAAGAASVLLLDPSQYWVRQVRSVRIERSDEYAFDTDLISWKAVYRGGGDMFDLRGFKVYKSA